MATPCQPFWPLIFRWGRPMSMKAWGGEFPFLALDLLHAEHVGRLLGDEAGGLFGAQADGVRRSRCRGEGAWRSSRASRWAQEKRPGAGGTRASSCLTAAGRG